MFEFVGMPMELRNIVQTLQKTLNDLFRKRDDILVSSNNQEHHQHPLKELFSLLQAAGAV